MASGRYMNIGGWKHEEPFEIESEFEINAEAESPLLPPTFSIFGIPPEQPQPKPKQPKSNDNKQRVTEQRAIRERKREASRPYYQFVYQISKERERIEGELSGRGTADINTRAYENIKNTWIMRGIWNRRWHILPGMSWKHEEPLEEADDGPAPIPANSLANSSHNAAPAKHIFGPPSPKRQPNISPKVSDNSSSGVDTAEPQPSPNHRNSAQKQTDTAARPYRN